MNDTHHKLHHFKLGVSTQLHTNVHHLCISLVLYNLQKQENCVESSVTTADNMNMAEATLDFKIMMLSRKGVGETWPKIRCCTGDKEGFSLKVQVVNAT